MKNFNFNCLQGCSSLKRVGLVLALCLMTITQVWASRDWFEYNMWQVWGWKTGYGGDGWLAQNIHRDYNYEIGVLLPTSDSYTIKGVSANTSGTEVDGVKCYWALPSGSQGNVSLGTNDSGNDRYWEHKSMLDYTIDRNATPGNYAIHLYFKIVAGGNEYSENHRQIKWTIPGFYPTSTSGDFGSNNIINMDNEMKISFNHYGTALTTGNCSISGGDASMFTVRKVEEDGVTVVFKPTSTGTKSTTLTITDVYSRTCTITLSGSGTALGTTTRLYFNDYTNHSDWAADAAEYRFSLQYSTGVYTQYPMTRCDNSTYNYYADVEIKGGTISTTIDRYNPSSPYVTWNSSNSVSLSSTYPYAISNGKYSVYRANHPFNNTSSSTSYFYYDNSESQFSSTLYLIIGRDYQISDGESSLYSKSYSLGSSPISNTKLFKMNSGFEAWPDATYYAVVGASSAPSAGSWGSSSLPSKGNKGYTAAYTGVYDLESGGYYLASAPSSNSAMTITKISGYEALNCTITVAAKVKAVGGSYTAGASKGAISASSKKFTSATSCGTGTSASVSKGSSTPSSFIAGYTATTSLSVSSVADGYTFTGWYDADGNLLSSNTSYTTYLPKATTTVYAYFEEDTYTITYNNMTGATNPVGNPSSYSITSDDITLLTPTKSGYGFAGWYSDEDCTTRVETIPEGSYGDINLYAVWLPIHKPGVYTSSGVGGYNKTLKSWANGLYERYGVYNGGSADLRILADASTSNTTGIATFTIGTYSSADWIRAKMSNRTSGGGLSSCEFTSFGNHAFQLQTSSDVFIICVQGYDSLRLIGKDASNTKGNNQYIQVKINGEDRTSDNSLSSSSSIRKYKLDASTLQVIQISGASSSGGNTIHGFSLRPAAPSISVHPDDDDKEYAQGASATALSVTASPVVGGATLSYQWYSCEDDEKTNAAPIDGATSSSYTPLTTSAGTTYYYCVVSEEGCNIATSNVSGAITVTASCSASADAGADKSTTVGVGVAMAATAASSGYTGAWSIKTGSPSTDDGQLGTTSSNTMTFTPNTSGTYTLVWTVTDDTDGSCYATNEADVTVTRNTPTQYTVSGTATICSGGNTNITLSGSQTGASYQLKKGGDAVGDPKSGTGSSLTWNVSETGTYTVSAVQTTKYSARDMSGSATVSFYDAVSIDDDPTAAVNANVNEATALSGLALSSGTFNNVAYQWYTCDDAEKTNPETIDPSDNATADDATLSITPASVGVTYYYCEVSDDCGNEDESAVVTVTAKNAISPSISYASTSIAVDAVTAAPTVSGNTGSGTVSYSSSNTSVATVDSDGKVTAKAVGSATITATIGATASYWGNTATATFTVGRGSISPSVDYSSVGGTTLAVGATSSGSPTVGGNTGEGAVTYSVTAASPEGCATVNESTGVVTAVHPGTATITASVAATTNYNSGSATANFTITKADISPTLTYSSTSIAVSDVTSAPTVDGNTGSGTVTYAVTSASPAGCVTVNESTGVVTAVAAGTGTVTATIAATDDYNSGIATADFTVSACTPINASVTFDNNKSAKYNTAWSASDISTSGGASCTTSTGTAVEVDSHANSKMAMKLGDGNTEEYIKVSLPSGITSGSITIKVCTYAGKSGTVIINDEDNTTTPLVSAEAGKNGDTEYYKINGPDEASWAAPTLKTITYDEITSGGDFYIKRSSGKSIYVFSVTATGTKACGYAITKDVENGTIAVTDGSSAITSAEEGDKVYIEVTPDAGYSFTSLSVTETVSGEAVTLDDDDDDVPTTRSFTMPDAAVTVTATFTAIRYYVKWNSDPHARYTIQVNSETPNEGSVYATVGQTITLATTSVDANYHLATWGVTKTKGGDAVAMATTNTFVMPAADVTVRPIFGKYYTVTFNSNDGATTPSSQTQTAVGQELTMPAGPTKSGNTFVCWMIGGTTVAAGGKYAPPTDVTAYAVWKADCAAGSGILFSQDFSSAAAVAYTKNTDRAYDKTTNTLSNLVGDGANLFTSLTLDGASSSDFAINTTSGQGKLDATGIFQAYKGNSSDGYWSLVRTNDFAVTAPTALKVEMDIWYNALSSGSYTGVNFAIGNGFSDGLKTSSAQSASYVHSGFGITNESTPKMCVYDTYGTKIYNTAYTTSTWMSITWIINNTGSSLTYDEPDGSGTTTLADDKFDIWLKTQAGAASTYVKVVSAQTAVTGTVDLQEIHIGSNSGAQNEFRLDNVKVTDLNAASACKYVTYDGNGAAGGCTYDPTAYAADAEVTVLENSFSHPGYTFAGWNTQYDGEGTSYAADATFNISANTTLYAQWTPAALTFTGGSGADWTDPRNWTDANSVNPACVPTIDHDVIIPRSATLYGPYAEDYVGRGVAKSIKIDKTVNSTTKLSIWSQASLIVAEGITAKHAGDADYGATKPADLRIETSVLGNGGLICGGASDNTEATYQFYTKTWKWGKWYINQYVGIPFVSMEARQLPEFRIFEYDDENDAWATPENSILQQYKSYNYIRSYSGSSWNEFDLTGTLVLPGTSGSHIFACGWRNREDAKWTKDNPFPIPIDTIVGHQDFMFANSWTAPIDIASMTAEDFVNVVQTIYIFNAGYVDPGNSQKEIGDLAGQWSSFPIASAASMDDAVIPATQTFAVTATAENASVTLKYGKHVYTPALGKGVSTFATRAPRRSFNANAPIKLKMIVRSEDAIADKLYLFERPDFTEEFDNGWDGHKAFGKTTVPQLYALQGGGKFAVDAVPEMDGTEIGFKAGTNANVYTFQFEYTDEEEPLYLYDRETEEYTRIDNQATYSFKTEDTAEHARFVLRRSTTQQQEITTGAEEIADDEPVIRVQKVMINEHIYIIRGGRVYSITGALVK